MAKKITPELEKKKNEIIDLIKSFTDKHLTEEYTELCIKMLEKLGRKHEVPFKRGKNEIWAASIIYAIGTINFLFDKDSQPHSTVTEINDFFGTSKNTTGNKSRDIRDMLKITHFDEEFSTKKMTEQNPFNNLVMLNGMIYPIASLPPEIQEQIKEKETKQKEKKQKKIAKNQTAKIYQLKISLKHIKPTIYRTIQIQDDFTLEELSYLIQDLFDWEGYHLFEFKINGKRYDDEEDDSLDTEIGEIITKINQKFQYNYDFGDFWEHEIVLEKILENDTNEIYPKCVSGKRNSPPEDCGGPWAYMNILEKHNQGILEKDEDLWEWLGEEFDPDYFDIDEINDFIQ